MAYTQNQEALRNALWNFIGQLAENSAYSGDMAKQSVIALMSEEMAKLCKNEDDTINMVIAKPILKNASWLLDQRANNIDQEIKSLEGQFYMLPDDYTDNAIKNLKDLSKKINDYIDKI